MPLIKQRLVALAAVSLFAMWSCLMSASASAASADDDFLAAREAFRVGDAVKLERIAASLGSHTLEPYVAYWRLKLRLEQASASEVQALLARLRDGPLSNILRGDWLRLMGSRQQWDVFDAEYPLFVGDDVALRCYALQSRLRSAATEAASAARGIWLSGRELPESCNTLFDTLFSQKHFAAADAWTRLRLALEAGNTGVARRVAEYLPATDQPDARALAAIGVNPQAFLDARNFNLKTRGGRETVMFAAHRLARTSPMLAAEQWAALQARFSEAERAYVWGVIAFHGAQRHDASTLSWFARAGELNDNQLGWKVRAALRARSWNDVLAAVGAMSGREAQDPAWRYWKARALKALGRDADAQALLTPLASDHTFYGQLAAEELGMRIPVPPVGHKPAQDEMQAIERMPGIQRAFAFYRLNLRFEGNREWIWTTRDYDDKQLLAAAEIARRHEIHDRSINTADRTRELHDFGMRYPTPFRSVMKNYATPLQLDEAWVYGLIRQESRFITDARSSAGASGLMQLMPATARWVAGKMGLKDFRPTQTNVIETNISLGTWYLKHVLETLDNHPVLASAAYNAGPGRARAWRADNAMEAAVYAESIPFSETRDYVKKVMSNASYYGQQLGHAWQALKERIGVIAPRSRAPDKPADEPGG